MKKGYTHISVVLDRSGSMASCKEDAEGGLNHFIEEQKKQPGEATLTLVRFDHQYEIVHDGIRIQSADKIVLKPGGSTALYDAVGKTIASTGEFLKLKSEDQRPEHVIFVIVTDGHENSSHEFSHSMIKEMIKLQTDAYKWEFVYLGATFDAVDIAHAMGVQMDAAISNDPKKYRGTYAVLNKEVNALRANLKSKITFTVDDRDSVK